MPHNSDHNDKIRKMLEKELGPIEPLPRSKTTAKFCTGEGKLIVDDKSDDKSDKSAPLIKYLKDKRYPCSTCGEDKALIASIVNKGPKGVIIKGKCPDCDSDIKRTMKYC